MPTEILQIAGTTSPDGWSVFPTGTTKPSAMNDASDSTYMEYPGTGNDQQLTLSTPNTTQAEDITGDVNSLTVNIRAKRYSGLSGAIVISLGVGGSFTTEQVLEVTTTLTNYTKTFTERPGGGAWTFDDLQNVQIKLRKLTNTGQVTALSLTADYDITHALNAPTALTISDIDSDFVTLTWTDNSGKEDNYEIQRSLDGIDWETIDTVLADVETYTDNTVASDTEYFYRVRATNGFFQSDWSDEVSDTTPPYSGPALEPTDLGITAITPTSLQIAWLSGGATDSYELQESADGGTTWTTIAELPEETSHWSVTGKLPGSEYMYRVRGVNTVGNSAWVTSDEVKLPERSFRDFLQNEVLQDVVKFFGWYDRVKLPDQEFQVTQTFYAGTNLTAKEIAEPSGHHWTAFGIQGPLIYDFKTTDNIKITPPLITELPEGTLLFGIGPKGAGMSSDYFINGEAPYVKADQWDAYLTAVTAYYDPVVPTVKKVMVEQNPTHIADDGSVLIPGAGIGDDVIYLKFQEMTSTGTLLGPERPFTMSGGYNDFRSMTGGFWRTFFNYLTITTDIDYSLVPFDASFIYDSITNDALLRLGYTQESEVPENAYQQFRDAGRVAAWRFVAYSSVHLNTITENITIDTVGESDVTKAFNQIFEMALKELDIAEQTYKSRYEVVVAPVLTSTSKPRLSSYSSGVTVRF